MNMQDVYVYTKCYSLTTGSETVPETSSEFGQSKLRRAGDLLGFEKVNGTNGSERILQILSLRVNNREDLE